MNTIRRMLLLLAILLVAGTAQARHPMAQIQTGWHTAGTNQGDVLQISAYEFQRTGQVVEFWSRMLIDGRWKVGRLAVACSDQRYMIVAATDQAGELVLIDGEDTELTPGSNVTMLAQRACGQAGLALGAPAPKQYPRNPFIEANL
jgi:hypothetical protein